ncbi:MAG: MBL fold metallo-hydrolase, partial [Actinobacteria bacterium]|nr:MBL fold metallo-hydrolase [Actinomycetota bacterium]
MAARWPWSVQVELLLVVPVLSNAPPVEAIGVAPRSMSQHSHIRLEERHLERALDMVGLRLEHVRLLVCTHAHADHCGQAAVIVERAGCELWMHPNHAHLTAQADDPEQTLARRIEVARQSGVPEEPLRRWAEARRGQGLGVAGPVQPDRELLPGVTVQTDLGDWTVHETPGHAPSHVCLHQAGRRML